MAGEDGDTGYWILDTGGDPGHRTTAPHRIVKGLSPRFWPWLIRVFSLSLGSLNVLKAQLGIIKQYDILITKYQLCSKFVLNLMIHYIQVVSYSPFKMPKSCQTFYSSYHDPVLKYL